MFVNTKHAYLVKLISAFLLAGLLAACGSVTPEAPIADLDSELEATASSSLKGNPNFSENKLPADVRLWYKRLWVGIKNSSSSVNNDARSGDSRKIGRTYNEHVTSLLTAFRATGDLRLLDEIDRSLQLARAQLKDTNNDGYVNWRSLNTNGNPDYYGDDKHKMNEMLAHAMVAEVAYAYKANEGLRSPTGVNYAERAKFWTNYLKKHFEAKWRKRNKTSSGSYNFLTWNLIHPYTQFIRYHYYMHKLTGERGYLNQAQKMALGVALSS